MSRGARRQIRRDLRAWRRYRRRLFETWAGLITAEEFPRAALFDPVLDDADTAIAEIEQTLQEHA